MSVNAVGLLNGFLGRREAANELRVGVRTLDRWRSQKAGPPFVRVGGRRFYRRADLDRFINEPSPS